MSREAQTTSLMSPSFGDSNISPAEPQKSKAALAISLTMSPSLGVSNHSPADPQMRRATTVSSLMSASFGVFKPKSS